MGKMGRTLGRKGQWVHVALVAILAVLGIPLAVSRWKDGNPIGGGFLLANVALLVWVAVRRVRILRGWTEPPGQKRLFTVVGALVFGVASTLAAISCFIATRFRDAVSPDGANVLGAFWAIAAVCWFLIAWMVWTGRTRVPAGK